MVNTNYIVCFDLETGGFDFKNDEIIQVAALAIDPHTLEIVEDSKFESLIKPVGIFSGKPAEVKAKWDRCQGAWDVNKKTFEELKNAPLPEHVWGAFSAYCKKYSVAGWGGKPIPAGHNIQSFDLPFLEETCRKYKIADKQGKQPFFRTNVILDTMNVCFGWFEHLAEPDGPENLKMDTLRKYFGIDEVGHDAFVDVVTTSRILIRFLKMQRAMAKKRTFKGSFSK